MANKRGAPLGNNNAGKGRKLSSMLRKRLEEREKTKEVVDALIDKAVEGDMPAIKEIFDRMDGKVKQAIIGGDDEDPAIKITRIELVALNDDD